MNRAYKFKLLPTPEQHNQLVELCGISRYVWNYMLDQNKSQYQIDKKFVFVYEMNSQLPGLKKEHPWMAKLPSQALQQRCTDLDQAIKRVYKSGFGFPKYRSRHIEAHNTFRIPNQNRSIRPRKNNIGLPKIGDIRWIRHRELQGKLKSVTIKRENNRWWAVCLCELPGSVPVHDIAETEVVGIDLGIKDFAVMSDGVVIPSQNHYRKREKRLAWYQKQLPRKQKNSRNYVKARERLNKQHYKVKSQRLDFTHQQSGMIAKYYRVACVEDLNIAGMKRNKRLAKSISDQGWRIFLDQLAYKIDHLVKIDRFAPSSKTCSSCGHVQDMPLNVRSYNCGSCGMSIDRDLNAAFNIHRWGLEKIIGQGTVRIYACGDTADGDISPDMSSHVSFEAGNNDPGIDLGSR